MVHHGEHAVEALVGLADQVTGGAVEVEHAGGRRLDPHLVFDRTTRHAVALARVACGVRQELGHNEQRDAFGARRCIRQFRQYQVHDILAHVVFASGDKNLAAGHGVAAIRLRYGPGFDDAQVGTAVGFSQAHSPGPLTFSQLAQVGLFLRVSAVGMDRRHRAMGQAGVHPPGRITRPDHFADDQAQRQWQSLPAISRIRCQAVPAALDVLGKRFLEALGCGDHALIEMTAFFIARPVQRRQHLFAEFGPFFKDCADHIRARVVSSEPCVMSWKVKNVVDQKAHIAQGSFIVRHGFFSGSRCVNLLRRPDPNNHTRDAECAVITQPPAPAIRTAPLRLWPWNITQLRPAPLAL